MRLLLLILFALPMMASAQAPVIDYQLRLGNLNEPLDVVNAGDGTNRLFIVQRAGQIRIWDGANLLPTPFIDVYSLLTLSGSERGLLSMAFHPNYASNRYFFIYYTATSGALTLARYRTQELNPNAADPASGVVLLSIPHASNSNHNGGKLNFGSDGYLYIGTGDGGGSNDVPNNAQTGTSLLGKMLRLDVNDFNDVTPPLYSIPASNPYTTVAGVNNEIIALGLRNPWRWSFDRLTGDMWIADVGQNAREEVDFRRQDSILEKTNYGWRCLEGSITNPSGSAACPPPPDNVFPIFDYGHNSNGGYVITGGYVYRATEYPPLYGYYVCTDYATGNIWLIKSNGAGGWEITAQTVNRLGNISSFGEDENGVLYAVRLTNGTANSGALYKIVTPVPLPLKLVAFTGSLQEDHHFITWKTTNDELGNLYELERKKAGENNFASIDKIVATAAGEQAYTRKIPAQQSDAYYRLKMISTSGMMSYSPVIFLQETTSKADVFTLQSNRGNITVQLNRPARSIRVFSAVGALLYQQSINNQSGYLNIPIYQYKGILFVQVITDHGSETKKVNW